MMWTVTTSDFDEPAYDGTELAHPAFWRGFMAAMKMNPKSLLAELKRADKTGQKKCIVTTDSQEKAEALEEALKEMKYHVAIYPTCEDNLDNWEVHITWE